MPATVACELLSHLRDVRLDLRSLAEPIPVAAGTRVEETVLGGRRCLAIAPAASSGASILYVHGSAFCLMRADPYTRMAGHLAATTGSRVLIPDYRLPPEQPYPLPLLDVLGAYVEWIEDAHGNANRVLAGDSAGANLALSALALARGLGLSMPSLVVVFSPWLDLMLRGRSVVDNTTVDDQLDPRTLAAYARAYAGAAPLDHPNLSPVSVQAPFPPLLIQAGSDEILLDDARALAASAAHSGVDVALEVAPGMQHNYQFWGPLQPAATHAYASIAAAMDRVARGQIGGTP